MFKDGVASGVLPESRDVVSRATTRGVGATRKVTKAELTQALKATDLDRASLLDQYDNKPKEVETLRRKNSDLSRATETARAASRESKRRMRVVEKEKVLLKKELEDVRESYEEEVLVAIRALKEKEQVSLCWLLSF